MTEDQIQLVQRTFAMIEARAEQTAAVFYSELFSLDPSLRPLFKGDLAAQGRKLMAALKLVVQGLHRLDALRPAVRDLGVRHAGYGVQSAHYATVGVALLNSVQQALGADCTPAVRAAWLAAYQTLADVMQDAARASAAPLRAMGSGLR